MIDNNIKLKKKKSLALSILKHLTRLAPNAKITLDYSNNIELLFAVILSAQCTDKKVNEITEKLFKKYTDIDAYIKVNTKEFEKDIYSAGFYKNKTKNILASAKIIKEEFNGEVPNTMKDILKLPGVSRKTANVVLSNAYGVVEGIAVDTHVIRLSQKMGLTVNKTPEKIEKDLMKIIPKKDWKNFTNYMIEYGRKYCPAKKHNHDKCPIKT
jgi:endonuclease-3